MQWFLWVVRLHILSFQADIFSMSTHTHNFHGVDNHDEKHENKKCDVRYGFRHRTSHDHNPLNTRVNFTQSICGDAVTGRHCHGGSGPKMPETCGRRALDTGIMAGGWWPAPLWHDGLMVVCSSFQVRQPWLTTFTTHGSDGRKYWKMCRTYNMKSFLSTPRWYKMIA